MQIIINAGGNGTRLWPISTKQDPKQFVGIIDSESLLQKTYFRLVRQFRSDQVWVTTNTAHVNIVRNQLGPNFQGNNVLTEPERRDTFAAVVAHAAVVASKTSENETLLFISSDHYIDNNSDYSNFVNTIEVVDKTVQLKKYDIILPATKPYYPATGYGYIKFDVNSKDVVNPVLSFKEKPSLAVAEKFLASKEYYWNLGYFAFTYAQLKTLINQFYPELMAPLNNIYNKGIIEADDYKQFPVTGFDFAILEKAKNLGTIDMNLSTWDDIGSFEKVYDYLPQNDNNSKFFQSNGSGNKYISNEDKPIAFAGVSDLLVINNSNGLLIIDPNKGSGSVKDIASWFDK